MFSSMSDAQLPSACSAASYANEDFYGPSPVSLAGLIVIYRCPCHIVVIRFDQTDIGLIPPESVPFAV